jgi:hypothetical protein
VAPHLTPPSAICLWNVVEGSLQHRIMVEKDKGKHVIIWCLKLLRSMTIVNGDSRGRVQVRRC